MATLIPGGGYEEIDDPQGGDNLFELLTTEGADLLAEFANEEIPLGSISSRAERLLAAQWSCRLLDTQDGYVLWRPVSIFSRTSANLTLDFSETEKRKLQNLCPRGFTISFSHIPGLGGPCPAAFFVKTPPIGSHQFHHAHWIM